jgi:predicted ATP-grasp superfamily ATP-dependent carboligase
LLIGASTRALAFSVLRCGQKPWCLDLFADADLLAFVPDAKRCPFSEYPNSLEDLLCDAPDGPVVYTGGLENYPRLVSRLAERRTLWGNDERSLRLVRDPFHVANLLSAGGLRRPGVFDNPRDACGRFQLLRKPRKSAGGAHISIAQAGDPESKAFYFQQFIPGPSFAAVFCAYRDRTVLLGVTEQLTGEEWLNAKPFHYCGSIGPISCSAMMHEALFRIGETLRLGCGLRGLFGVDFILNDNCPWPVEVNPRYTASIEVLEYASHQCTPSASGKWPILKTMEHHRAAFDDGMGGSDRDAVAASARTIGGKAVLFAPEALIVPPQTRIRIATDPFIQPDAADIPRTAERIEEGWPILTVFAEGASADDCRAELKRRCAELMRWILADWRASTHSTS